MIMMALLAVVLSVEFMLGLSALLKHVPVAVDPTVLHSILWHYQAAFQPQRNLFLYVLWIAMGIGAYGCLWRVMKTDLKAFLIFHLVIVGLMLHAAFEIGAGGDPVWARPVFWGTLAVGVTATIFWPVLLGKISWLKNKTASWRISPWMGVVGAGVFIFLVIFMPDLQSVVAMEFLGNYFRNWDSGLFGTVYAITHGLRPGIEVYATYGFGASVMTAKMVNWMGGFEYTRVLAVLMWVGIIYFSLWFLFLRKFLASTLLALAAIVWAIQVQMFCLDVMEPLIWSMPASSVFRYCFDIGVFWMLWRHIQTQRIIFLAAAAVFVSLGLYHLLSTGTYLFIMFTLYACLSAFLPGLGGSKNALQWGKHALVILSVLVWTAVWFYLTVGTHFWEGAFQRNLAEFNSYFVRGDFAVAFTWSALPGDFARGFGGLVLPVFYLATFLYAAGEVMARRACGRDVLAGLLAFYGLENHSYFLLLVNQWYTMGLPGVFLGFYWITKGLARFPDHWRRRVACGLLVAALYALMTNRFFTAYPNLLNLSRNPIVDSRTAIRIGPRQLPYFNVQVADFPETYKLPLNSLGDKDEQLKYEKDFSSHAALKVYYAQQTALREDSALIRRLTPDGGKAAVISSFELLFLQRADRKPFFYYFPLIKSRMLTGRNFMETFLFGYPQLQKVLDQLQTEKPAYIFMERIFLTPQVPSAYFYDFGEVVTLLRYVFLNYEPVETGKYLVAMKRK